MHGALTVPLPAPLVWAFVVSTGQFKVEKMVHLKALHSVLWLSRSPLDLQCPLRSQ
jgi:hypothetical protein